MSLRGRVGLFGGAFNPIHVGHLRVAEEALRQFDLAKVIFIPTAHPPHKEVAVPAELRYRMVELAVQGRPGFEVSRIEMETDGPAYTVDTVRAMLRRYPQGVAYIVGADAFLGLPSWKEADELMGLCPFIIAPRRGIDPEALRRPPLDRAEIHLIRMDPVEISSSEIRRRYREGLPVEGLVPEEVDRFIRAHGIYR
ncbi:MAG: nicotinate (nicotinamide) nucleotide adenylyltransferase [Caldiserica bacterium]|nr:nicotinate (nicotinamide) nucleotide adenylyltransferase [Caldisericota bacterium]